MAKLGTISIKSTILQGGRKLGISYVRTSKNLLSESKIQYGVILPLYGLNCPWKTFKDIKIIIVGDSNSLANLTTKLIPIYINAEL
jgi:hypothetical protein